MINPPAPPVGPPKSPATAPAGRTDPESDALPRFDQILDAAAQAVDDGSTDAAGPVEDLPVREVSAQEVESEGVCPAGTVVVVPAQVWTPQLVQANLEVPSVTGAEPVSVAAPITVDPTTVKPPADGSLAPGAATPAGGSVPGTQQTIAGAPVMDPASDTAPGQIHRLSRAAVLEPTLVDASRVETPVVATDHQAEALSMSAPWSAPLSAISSAEASVPAGAAVPAPAVPAPAGSAQAVPAQEAPAALAPAPVLVAQVVTGTPSPVSALAVSVPPVAASSYVVASSVQSQLGHRLVALAEADQGVHRLSVQLHPQDLGIVQVVAVLSEGRLHLQLSAGSDLGREALRGALADLRADLASAGLGAETTLDLSEQGPDPRGFSDRSGSAGAEPGERRPALVRSVVETGWTQQSLPQLLPSHPQARPGRALDVRV